MAKKRLNLAQSQLVVKWFYELLRAIGTHARWGFFEATENDLVALGERYTLSTVIPSIAAPYKRTEVVTEVMSVLMKYLSRGNLHTPIGEWVADGAGGNKAAAAVALASDLDAEEGAMPAIKAASSAISDAVEWIEKKICASSDVLLKSINYDKVVNDSDDVVNRVIAGEITKDQALRKANEAVETLDELLVTLVTYLELEPNDKELSGLALMFGGGPLKSGVTADDINGLLEEAQRSDPLVALRVNTEVDERKDFPTILAAYNGIMDTYAQIKRIDDKEADQRKLFKRHVRNLHQEASEVAESIWRPKSLDSVSLVCDLAKQVDNLKSRFSNLQGMTDEDVKIGQITFLSSKGVEDKDFNDIIKEGKSLLLQRKDTLVSLQKDEENKQKAFVNQSLRDQPRTELIELESRRDAVRFVTGLKKMKSQFRDMGLPDADEKVLILAKKKLKIDTDRKASKHMESLKELERYLKITYINEVNLMDDLLCDLREWGPPSNSASSIQNIQESLAVLATIRRKKMGPKFQESDLEDILRNSLLRSDIREFRRAYAKEKLSSKHNSSKASSSKLGGDSDSDSESDASIDWNQTILEEVEDTNMDARRKFLTKFLKIKLVQLQDTEKGDRNRKEVPKENKDLRTRKVVKFKGMKDKIFVLEEIEDYEQQEDSDSDVEEIENLSELSLYAGKVDGRKGGKGDYQDKGSKKSYRKRPCPLKCEKAIHTNGSLFFCPLFRKKPKEERRILQKKCHLCITCLSKAPDPHECPFGSCHSCGAKHNILLCPKEAPGENANNANEVDDDTADPSGDEDDYNITECNSAFLASKSPHGPGATSTPSKTGSVKKPKSGGENKKEGTKKANFEISKVDEERLETIKQYLSDLVEKRKCKPLIQEAGVNRVMLLEERVCFIRECNTVSDPEEVENEWKADSYSEPISDCESKETIEVESDLELPMSEEQDYEADSESGEYEHESDGVITSSRCSNDEASEDEEHNVDEPGTPLQEESVIGRSVQSETGTELEEEEVSQSDDERDEMDLAPSWEMNFLRKGFKMSDIFESDEDSVEFSSLDENDSEEGEYDSKAFLMTSVANLRRRESLGIPTVFKFKSSSNDTKKEKESKEDTSEKASLEETKIFLKEGLERDDRGIKQRTPKRSNYSKENWGCNERWKEIIEEGVHSQENCERVCLLQEPVVDATSSQHEVVEGWTKTTLGPVVGGAVYEKMLQTAVEAFNIVSANGRNMSSMLTPLTLLGDKELVNLDLAKREEIPFKEVENGVIFEITGCTDTGADVTVNETETRKLLGREELPDAKSALQGCTGSSNDKLQDKLRFVDEEGEVTVVETRGVETLGKTAPDSPQYIDCVKSEFGINSENEHLFEFMKNRCKPRVLISLRSGSLLCKQLDEKDMLQSGLEVPCFSPELVVWKTPLNKKLLVSGHVGINPRLIEREHNFPRFNIVHTSNMSEKDLYELVVKKSTKLLANLRKIKRADMAHVSLESNTLFTTAKLGDQNESGENTNPTAYEPTVTGPNSPANYDVETFENIDFSEKYLFADSLLADDEKLFASNDGEVLIYSHNRRNENSFFSRVDAAKLQKFIEFESKPIQTNRKCIAHRSKCEACILVNKSNHRQQSKLMVDLWDNIQAVRLPDGNYQIYHTYSYRNDVDITYHPSKSNIIEAAGHSKRTIRRAHDNGSLALLETQVNKMIDKGNFVELDDEEILGLSTRSHNFTLYNHVFNGNSSSTPYRMISNTSSVSSGTTISTEMMAPDQTLNNMEASLVRFRIHPIALCGDIKSAYHCVKVDLKSTYLRLFYWWYDLPSCKRSRLFRQVTQSFGDTAASAGLEVAILRYVATHCKLDVDKFLVEHVRYADNLVFSFRTLEEYLASKADLNDAFKTYSMPLKYIITSCNFDPDVLADEARGPDPCERLLGLNWSLLDDSLTAVPDFNVHGSARGAKLGPSLFEMSDKQILETPITRLIIMRLAAQSYNRLQDILGPLTTSIKGLVSRSCELASIDEMNVDLEARDAGFCSVVRKFIMNLRKVAEIRPFRRAWVPENHSLCGFAIPVDGGKMAFGAGVYSLAAPTDGGDLDRSICSTRSRISKRNIVAHESQAGPLGVDAASTILDPLLYDYGDYPLELFFMSDSTCMLSLLNPSLDIKNTLLANACYMFVDKLIDLSLKFPKATLSVGFVPGQLNPADFVSKMFIDPVETINSQLYRVGPEKFGKLETLREDIVAIVKQGEFTYHGIPLRFLQSKQADVTSDERCLYCNHGDILCGSVMTRAQGAKKDQFSDHNADGSSCVVRAKVGDRMKLFLRRVRFHMTSIQESNLLDEHTKIDCEKVLTLEQYHTALGKFFTFNQFFRHLCWIVAIDRAKLGFRCIPPIKLRREAFAMLLRTSQAFYNNGVARLADHELWSIKVMSLRLQFNHSEGLFGGNFMAVIGRDDPVTVKILRNCHQLADWGLRSTHRSRKATYHKVSSGGLGVTWLGKKKDVKDFADKCGICNKQRISVKSRPFMGPALARVLLNTHPFSHCSIDPLGYIRVRISKYKAKKIYPLICVDINTGAISFEILDNMETKEVYLALMRLQWKYSTQITQLFTDKGSQLSEHLLGEGTEFYQKKLKELWCVKNNAVGAQFRNYCERKTRCAKTIIRESLSGQPGMLPEVSSYTELQTVLELTAHSLNFVPYADAGNEQLLSPGHILAPWQVRDIPVQDLPRSRVESLQLTRDVLRLIRERAFQTLSVEFAELSRFSNQRLNLGSNKAAWNCTPGSVVGLIQGGKPVQGVVVRIERGRDATVRLSSGKLKEVALGTLQPIAMAEPSDNGNGSFTHFISIELGELSREDGVQVELFQDLLSIIPGIGKMVSKEKLHITMAVIRAPEPEDVRAVLDQTQEAIRELVGIIEEGQFLIGVAGLIFLESAEQTCVASETKLGASTLKLLRTLICERLKSRITDQAFCPHLTLFRRSQLSPGHQRKAEISCRDTKLGTFMAEAVTVRCRKGASPIGGVLGWRLSLTDPKSEPQVIREVADADRLIVVKS